MDGPDHRTSSVVRERYKKDTREVAQAQGQGVVDEGIHFG